MSAEVFTEDDCAYLNQFASTVWGNARAVLRRSGDIEFIDLGRYTRTFGTLLATALDFDKIFVREEYRIALSELETQKYRRGAYVSGQPGIGKTLFLVYLLVTCLGKKRTVALQFPDGRPFYALFKDSVTFHSTNDRKSLVGSGLVWALSDSNNQVQSPCGIFLGTPAVIRVIQVTSPKTSRWKEWSKQVRARCYVMDIWSQKELADLTTLMERDGVLSREDGERMTALAKSWGYAPRTVLECLEDTDKMIEERYRAAARAAVRKCGEMVIGAVGRTFPDEAPLMFFFVRPKITAEGITHRQEFSVCVPTRTLRTLLGEALKGQSNSVKLEFFNALSLPSETRSTAGYIYEIWFHNYFSAENLITCQFLGGDGGVRELRGATTLIPATKDAPKSKAPPYYWVAPKGFPGIDSALVLRTEIFAFQATIRSLDHTTPLDGLKILRANLRDDLKSLPWRVIFVGPDKDSARNVATEWVDKIAFPTRANRVPIGYAKLDPVQDGVNYRVFHDETDPVPDEVTEAVAAARASTSSE